MSDSTDAPNIDGSDGWPAQDRSVPAVPDLTGWLARRDTIRQFDPEADIPETELREIIDAGRKVPTSGTIQMYSFVRITDPDTRAKIHAHCGYGQPQVEESSHFLLVCVDLRRVRMLHEHRDLDFSMSPLSALLKGSVDASLAAQGAMIVAESRGYGVCPIGAIGEQLDEVAQTVDLPAEVLPIWGLCIGVPSDEAPDRSTPRVPLDAVLHDGEYRDPSPALLEACYETMNERYADSDRVWEGTLANYWTPAPEGSMNDREDTLLEALRRQGFFAYRGVDEPVQPPTARD
ncbi:MAG: nitroreductase family protein [Halobacteriales archaeon]